MSLISVIYTTLLAWCTVAVRNTARHAHSGRYGPFSLSSYRFVELAERCPYGYAPFSFGGDNEG